MSGKGMTDYFTTVQLIATAIIALLSFPLGLLIPIYFYIKADNGSAAAWGPWEVWGVILGGIIGIIAVELGGELGGKIAVALAILVPVLVVLAAVVGSFVIGLGGTAAAPALAAPAVAL